MGSILLAFFIYVLAVSIWNQRQIRKIRNATGGLMAGTEAALKAQEPKARELLVGFSPTEALSGIAAAATLLSLFYSICD
ncbi:MAG: hypothetical protein JWN18_233 [Parcubacteria group bacterium]|nr:hypothetical protein [Parcubacteria group bacterium]